MFGKLALDPLGSNIRTEEEGEKDDDYVDDDGGDDADDDACESETVNNADSYPRSVADQSVESIEEPLGSQDDRAVPTSLQRTCACSSVLTTEPKQLSLLMQEVDRGVEALLSVDSFLTSDFLQLFEEKSREETENKENENKAIAWLAVSCCSH